MDDDVAGTILAHVLAFDRHEYHESKTYLIAAAKNARLLSSAFLRAFRATGHQVLQTGLREEAAHKRRRAANLEFAIFPAVGALVPTAWTTYAQREMLKRAKVEMERWVRSRVDAMSHHARGIAEVAAAMDKGTDLPRGRFRVAFDAREIPQEWVTIMEARRRGGVDADED